MIIGVTGGVGSGKSTILGILKDEYNAAVIYADAVAKELSMPGKKAYEAVTGYFGDEILTDGKGSEIDRAKLSDIVFKDAEKLHMLNSFVHPPVKEHIKELISAYKKDGFTYIVIEAALLIQAGYKDMLDELWVVAANIETRIRRLMDTRGYSEEKTRDIIKNQLSDEAMAKQADFVIDNSYDIENTGKIIREHLRLAGNIDNRP